MAKETVALPYPHTFGATEGAIPAERQPTFSQETHPTKGANDAVPEVRQAGDHDDETANRAVKER